MGFMRMSFLSKTLDFHTDVNIIIPSDGPIPQGQSIQDFYKIKEKLPVLYLLHGGGGNAMDWCRFSSVERYAEERKIAVVMPQVGATSFYTDMAHGYPYFTFLSEELPQMVEALFPIGGSRDKRFVAGYSMGGYGALKWAMRKPEFFSAVAGMSGFSLLMDIFEKSSLASADPDDKSSIVNLDWGGLEKLRDSPDDTKYMLDRVGENQAKYPSIYACIGTEDVTYDYTQNFLKYAKKVGVAITYEEGPGNHDWKFWDTFLPRVMDWCMSQSNAM